MVPILDIKIEEAQTRLKISAVVDANVTLSFLFFSFNIHRKQYIDGNNNDQTYLAPTMTKKLFQLFFFFNNNNYIHAVHLHVRNVTKINKTLSCKL